MTSGLLFEVLSIGGVAAIVVLTLVVRARRLRRALRTAQTTLAECQAEHAAVADLGRLALAGLRPGQLRLQAAALTERVLGRDVRLAGADEVALGAPDASAAETAFPIDGRAAQHGALVVRGVVSPAERAFVRTMAAGLAVALEQAGADELLHPALYDTLTGLPGPVLFQDRLDGALARSSRRALTVAVLSCDLGGLQAVNDRHGHDAGDALLRVVAERLALFVRPGDTVTRFGGDEFVVLCEGIGGRDDAAALARRLVAAVTEPADLGTAVVQVAISVGVALGTDPVTPEALLEAAESARARAKTAGRGIVEVVDTAGGPAGDGARHGAPGAAGARAAGAGGYDFAPPFAA